MTHFKFFPITHHSLFLLVGVLAVSTAWPLATQAQNTASDSSAHKHAGLPADADHDLPAQIHELKAKAAALEASLKKRYPGAVSKDVTPDKDMSQMGGGGMSMMDDDDEEMAEMMKTMRTMMEMKMMQMKSEGMGMMDDDMMGSMQKSASGMGMMDDGMDMMGMMGKDKMGGKGMRMQMAAALPGFPGASHIYHIGATGFFLDHPEHVHLTTEQQTALNGVKRKTLLEQATMQRQIDEVEQDLWTLTASDEPDAKKIDEKVREIEKLRGDRRIAFIRAVGEAANVLTAEQRQVLVGSSSPDSGMSANPKN
jgi:hypothetical protein